jgi:hypothetical protein
MTDLENFWHTLFDPEDHTCFARTFADRDASPIASRNSDAISFSINALTPGMTRASLSVSKFRSFLLEFDEGTPREQLEYLKMMQCPFTSVVHSGGKSCHVILTLDEPLEDLAAYNFVTRWLHSVISFSDQNAIDPSRMSRIPGAFRPESGLEQQLLFIGNRVPNWRLFDFLRRFPDHRPIQEIESKSVGSTYRVNPYKAVAHCRRKWPLASGLKQSAMMSWATYLASNTGMEREEVIAALEENDEGCNILYGEYVRAVDRAFSNFGR